MKLEGQQTCLPHPVGLRSPTKLHLFQWVYLLLLPWKYVFPSNNSTVLSGVTECCLVVAAFGKCTYTVSYFHPLLRYESSFQIGFNALINLSGSHYTEFSSFHRICMAIYYFSFYFCIFCRGGDTLMLYLSYILIYLYISLLTRGLHPPSIFFVMLYNMIHFSIAFSSINKVWTVWDSSVSVCVFSMTGGGVVLGLSWFSVGCYGGGQLSPMWSFWTHLLQHGTLYSNLKLNIISLNDMVIVRISRWPELSFPDSVLVSSCREYMDPEE